LTGLALFGAAPVLSREAHRVWPIVGDDERRALSRVLDRGVLSGACAPESVALEEEFARFVGAKHCLLTHCGTSALVVALAAAGVRAGDEVVVPAYSFVATPLAVVQVGAVPVFADVDLATGCLEAPAAAAAVTPRTRAIMPVHMHGGAPTWARSSTWLAGTTWSSSRTPRRRTEPATRTDPWGPSARRGGSRCSRARTSRPARAASS
jgi:hypothetical protein